VIYELRVYRCMPGKLPDLLKRFEAVTLKLWESTVSARSASGPP
jgi:hypothetical protein